MSFVKDLKRELCAQKIYDKNLAISQLSALIRTGAEIKISKHMSVTIITDIFELYAHINRLLKTVYGASAELELSDEKNKNDEDKYEIIISEDISKKLLSDCRIIDFDDEIMIINYIDNCLISDLSLIKEYIKGAVIGCSTSSIQLEKKENKNSGYHLEFVFNSKEISRAFCVILSDINIFAKLIERRQTYVVYLKSFEQICDLLTLLSATKSVLTLQNENVFREVKNTVNRQNNCLTGNINKTISASMKQIEAINLLSSTIGLENLPEDLQQIAMLRLANQEESLDELIKLLDCSITKSSLNRKFQKLIKISNELK